MWRAFGVDPVKQLADFAFEKRPDVMDRCEQKPGPHSHSLNKAPKFQTPLTARRLRLETKTLLLVVIIHHFDLVLRLVVNMKLALLRERQMRQ